MSWLPRRRGRERPLVLDAQRSAVANEGVDRLASTDRLERVAVVAHWAADRRIDRSVCELIRAVAGNGYEICIVSTAPGSEPLVWPDDAAQVTVLRRPNLGYDFGSWATAFERYPAIMAADQVLLLNSSLVGPFRSIDHLVGHFQASTGDVWAMTDSLQYGHHLQSYCLGFRAGCLREGPLASFWREIRVEASRDEVIAQGELGLGRLIRREHFVADVAIPSWRVVSDGENPTIVGWRRLLDAGFPFVKRQLLREPEVARDGADVPEELRRRFGVAVEEWV